MVSKMSQSITYNTGGYFMMSPEFIPCVNCGEDLNYHSETQTEICLKRISIRKINARNDDGA